MCLLLFCLGVSKKLLSNQISNGGGPVVVILWLNASQYDVNGSDCTKVSEISNDPIGLKIDNGPLDVGLTMRQFVLK